MIDTKDYRDAPSGFGPLAAEWKDKPHRLVYDLCSEAERQRGLFRVAAERVNALSGRICRQAQSGEPPGELDIVNELNVIAYALALSGGVEVETEWGGPIDLGCRNRPGDDA